jgi:hypothetical protein
MPDVLDLLDNLESLNIKQVAIEALRDNEEIMADLNAGQMAKGKRATGTDIKPAYAPLTIELKKEKSGLASVTDRVTLYDTGSHYRNLYADVKGDEIEYGSKDPKSEDLQKKYGAIYGLTNDSKEELIEGHLEGDFYDKVKEATGL